MLGAENDDMTVIGTSDTGCPGFCFSLSACLLAAFVLGACSGGADSAKPTVDAYELVHDLTIGADDDVILGDVRGLAVDAWSRVYIFDHSTNSVVVVDSSGRLIRKIGRRGNGPGEFIGTGIAIGPGEHLFVYDPQQRRLSEFDTSGTLVRDHRYTATGYGPWVGGIDSLGRLVHTQSAIRDPRDTVVREQIQTVNLKTGNVEAVPLPNCEFGTDAVRHEFGFAMRPFGKQSLTYVDPNAGTWCASTEQPVAWFTPFGDTIPTDSVVGQGTARRVTVAEYRAKLEDQVGRVPPQLLKEFRDQMPEFKPFLRRVFRGGDGRVWMWLDDTSGTLFNVFDGGSEPVATYRVAENIGIKYPPLPVIRDGVIWTAGMDSNDVPVVFRFRAVRLRED